MPEKLILNIAGNYGEVFVELDGTRHKLRGCKSITIRADAEGNNEADLTLYSIGRSKDEMVAEVEITRNNAEAILRTDARRALSFIDDADAAAIKAWRDTTSEPTSDNAFMAAIDKILVELARRKEIPF